MMQEPAHILIVDDEPNGLYTLELLLSPDDYKISFAKDGYEALNKVEADPPDVLLLDVMMPGLTGYEVCAKLKGSAQWQHIPVILITALNQSSDLVAGFKSGADEFLTKPVEGLELRARVRSMLRIKRQYDALQETLKMRQKMADMIVHDMRNPVSNILLYADLLSYGVKCRRSPEKLIKIIQDQGLRLNSFLSDLLLTAKMSSGNLVLDRAEIDLRSMLETSCQNHEAQANARDITLHLDLPAEECALEVDARLVERTLQNLVSNAVKFSPDGGAVTIRARPINGASTHNGKHSSVCIEVMDEGPGIPLDKREHIFAEFGVVANGAPNGSQTGLGLALCRMVAEAHGGSIRVEDNQPRGTIMTLEL